MELVSGVNPRSQNRDPFGRLRAGFRQAQGSIWGTVFESLLPELPQMMIYVQIAPTHPLRLRHDLEQRVGAKLEVPLSAGEALHGVEQEAHIGFELRRGS